MTPDLMKRTILLLLFTPLPFLFDACVQKGCTDENAINYDPDANDNDGSCVYKKDFSNQVVKFSLEWDGDVYEGFEFDSSLTDRSVLLYMRHPDFPNEWAAMPFTNDGISYYYTEKPQNDRIYVYSEDIANGSAALGLTNPVTKDYKAVIMTNSFLKDNPEVKDMTYQELQQELHR